MEILSIKLKELKKELYEKTIENMTVRQGLRIAIAFEILESAIKNRDEDQKMREIDELLNIM